MRAPNVTFVIATYRRVDALRCTLRSLLLQAHTDWTALVIGDRCGDETGEMLRSLRDPRIRYYNLPRRFGEQSGPNTAGLHLAEGDFVSFLNHDDLLLRDHLVRALDQLVSGAADFHIGKFANATRLDDDDSGVVVPVFTEILPRSEDLRDLLMPDPWCFDPSSFWVIRTAYAKAVGPWRPAHRLWRTPLRDWLMRAWRRGGSFCFGDTVTGLRFWTQNLRSGAPLYSNSTPEHEYMIERMERESPDATRSFLRRQLETSATPWSGATPRSDRPSPSSWSGAWRWRVTKARHLAAVGLYLNFNVDPVSLLGRLRKRPAGALLEEITRRRTGESLPAQQTIQEFLSDPEAHRVL